MNVDDILHKFAKELDKYQINHHDNMTENELYHLLEETLLIRNRLSYSCDDDDLQDIAILQSLIDHLDDFDLDEE